MDQSALEHLLTTDEQATFERDGYLVVRNAITPSLHQRLIDVVDRVDKRERNPQHGNR